MGLSKKNSTTKVDDFFAIDIGASSVKVLQLKRKGSNWAVVGMASEPINRSIISDKVIQSSEKLSDAIALAVKKAKIKTKAAYTSIFSSQVTIKTFTIPHNLSLVEQEDFVALEARNYIPIPAEETVMDYEVLGPADEQNYIKILLVATKIDQHQVLVESVQNAGFDLKVMDVDHFTINRAMNYLIAKNPLKYEDTIEVLIDLGHEFTNIYVISEGKIIFNREQSFGMKQLTEEISRNTGVSISEAEAILVKGSNDETISQIIASFRSEAAQQINRLIQIFFADSSHNRVHRVWLSGGGASMPDLTSEVSDSCGVPTYIVNQFDGFETPKGLDAKQLQKLAPNFLNAFGLSIRED